MTTRRRLLSWLQTFLLVSLITALIWVWAEGESLSTTDITAEIVLVPGGDGALVARAEGAAWPVATGGRVQLRVRGTTNAVESARRTLVGPEPLRLEPGIGGVPGEPGLHTVRLAEAIRLSDRLRNIGLAIASAEPAEVSLRVHRLQSVRLPVRVVVGAGVFVGEPVVEPSEVLVRLPSELAERLGEGATARVELSVEQMGMFSESEPRTVAGVRVLLPADVESVRGETRGVAGVDGGAVAGAGGGGGGSFWCFV